MSTARPAPPVVTAPAPDEFYAVTFETLGGAVVGFVGQCLGQRPGGVLFTDVRTDRDVLVPEALSCIAVDGPWLSAREVRDLAG